MNTFAGYTYNKLTYFQKIITFESSLNKKPDDFSENKINFLIICCRIESITYVFYLSQIIK